MTNEHDEQNEQQESGIVRVQNSAISVDNEVMNGTFLAVDTDLSPEEQWQTDDEKLSHLNAASRCGQNLLHWYVGIQANRARNSYYPEGAPQTLEEVAARRDMSESAVSKASKMSEFFAFQDYKDVATLPRRVLYRATQMDSYDEAVQVLREWVKPYMDKEIDQNDMMDELDQLLGIQDASEEDPNEGNDDEDVDDDIETWEETTQDYIMFLQEFRSAIQREDETAPSQRELDQVKIFITNLKAEIEQTQKRIP